MIDHESLVRAALITPNNFAQNTMAKKKLTSACELSLTALVDLSIVHQLISLPLCA